MLPALVPGIWRAVACVASKGRAENLEPLGLGFGIQEALMGIHFSTTYDNLWTGREFFGPESEEGLPSLTTPTCIQIFTQSR